MEEKIGILHPGEMGVFVAASARQGGHDVYWASQGRSPHTRRRAGEHALLDAGTLEDLCQSCSIILSVCPPHAAEEVANQVAGCSFHGLYADLNAISPQRAVRIGERLAQKGIKFVDGGIIGGPSWDEGETTWLYLSGGQAQRVADCFSSGHMHAQVTGSKPGKASALKMCYAANTKGSTALLCAVLGAAESLGVRRELEQQWAHDDPAFPPRAARRLTGVTSKAWRFRGEMEEIAATFEEAGMPGGFHQAAAEIYRRLEGFKDHLASPSLEEALTALLDNQYHDRG